MWQSIHSITIEAAASRSTCTFAVMALSYLASHFTPPVSSDLLCCSFLRDVFVLFFKCHSDSWDCVSPLINRNWGLLNVLPDSPSSWLESAMKRFDENQFKSRVNAALQRVKTILDTSRNPQLPNDVPHEYRLFLSPPLLIIIRIHSIASCHDIFVN